MVKSDRILQVQECPENERKSNSDNNLKQEFLLLDKDLKLYKFRVEDIKE